LQELQRKYDEVLLKNQEMDHLCKTLQAKLDTALELGRKSLS